MPVPPLGLNQFPQLTFTRSCTPLCYELLEWIVFIGLYTLVKSIKVKRSDGGAVKYHGVGIEKCCCRALATVGHFGCTAFLLSSGSFHHILNQTGHSRPRCPFFWLFANNWNPWWVGMSPCLAYKVPKPQPTPPRNTPRSFLQAYISWMDSAHKHNQNWDYRNMYRETHRKDSCMKGLGSARRRSWGESKDAPTRSVTMLQGWTKSNL